MKRLLTILVVVLLAAVSLSACGGGGSSSQSSSAAPSGGSAKTEPSKAEASETLVPAPTETAPTKIQTDLKALPKPPPTGLNIINLQCDLPGCVPFAKTLAASSKALGWNLKTIVFKTGQPESAMTQAVNSPGVEYITMAGVPQSLIEPQLKEAAQKDITVMSCCDTSPPDPPTVPVQIAAEDGSKPAESLADYMINDSEGHANVVVVSLPEVPTITNNGPTVKKRLAEKCPECSFGEIPVTGEELAAATVPAKVVAYLQGHPDVNYVSVAFGSLLTGIPEAIKAAGMSDQVKVVGMQSLSAPEAAALEKGEVQAWWVSGQAEFGDLFADAIARDSLGLPLPVKAYEESPLHWMCKPETAKECTEWGGPAGFQEQYEKLWGVG